MPGFRGIMSVAEMRERRIKREEKEAREQGRKRVETPSKEGPPPTKPPIEPDAFRKRFLLADAKGRFGGVIKATSRKMPPGLLAQEEQSPPPPPPLHLPRIPHAASAFGNHEELMAQIGSEARGSLEALEQSELFTCRQAAEAPRVIHKFDISWSHDALGSRSHIFEPAPPPPITRNVSPQPNSGGATPPPQRRATVTPKSADSGKSGGGSRGGTTGRRPLTGGKKPASRPSTARRGMSPQVSAKTREEELPRTCNSAESLLKTTMTGEETRVAPVMKGMEQRAHAEMAALERELLRVMAYADGARTARARLELNAAPTSILSEPAGRRGGGRRHDEEQAARQRGGRSGGGKLTKFGLTHIDAELEEVRNARRAAMALEEAVEEDRQRKERESDRLRLKRIRLREEWLAGRGADEYSSVTQRLQQHVAEKQKSLEERAARAKRKLQVTLAWWRVGLTHLRRKHAAVALRQDCVNEALAAILGSVNSHIEHSFKADCSRRMQGREVLRQQLALRDRDFSKARNLPLQKASVLQRAFRSMRARTLVRLLLQGEVGVGSLPLPRLSARLLMKA